MPITAKALAAAAAVNHGRMLATLTAGIRHCGRCGQDLPLACFGRDPSAPSGYRGWCRSCCTDDVRQRRIRQRQAERQAAEQRQAKAAHLAQAQETLDKLAFSIGHAAHGNLSRLVKEAQGIPHCWRTRCCGGQLIDGGVGQGWLVAHQPGCRDPWQVSDGVGRPRV